MLRTKELIVLTICLLLFGCNSSANQAGVVVASENTLPANFDEIAYEKEAFHYYVRKAENDLQFEDLWHLYGFAQQKPDIDFNETDIFFIGIQESSSCPYKVENIEDNFNEDQLIISISEPEGACTADASPRTFVLQVDKAISKEVKRLIINQNGVDREVPFSN